MRAPKVADLRNIYEPGQMRELGFEYAGVGRGGAALGAGVQATRTAPEAELALA